MLQMVSYVRETRSQHQLLPEQLKKNQKRIEIILSQPNPHESMIKLRVRLLSNSPDRLFGLC